MASVICLNVRCCVFFFFNDTATTEIYTLSLHDALPIYGGRERRRCAPAERAGPPGPRPARHLDAGYRRHYLAQGMGCKRRSEEHTSELQSPCNLVCRLLLEKKTVGSLRLGNIMTHYYIV